MRGLKRVEPEMRRIVRQQAIHQKTRGTPIACLAYSWSRAVRVGSRWRTCSARIAGRFNAG